MADPRADVKLDGVQQQRQTFKIDDSTLTYESTKDNGSSHIGKAVTLSAARTVALADDGDGVLGRLEQVMADDFAVVTTKGYVKMPGGNGASLTLQKKIVGDQDSGANPGFIREVNTAQAAELGVARGEIIDAGTPAETVVLL